MSKQLPFTFVDHALRHGDSLVGLDFKQIEAFHWSPPGQVEMCRVLLREALDQAVGLWLEAFARLVQGAAESDAAACATTILALAAELPSGALDEMLDRRSPSALGTFVASIRLERAG